jgi:hypothetical protein
MISLAWMVAIAVLAGACATRRLRLSATRRVRRITFCVVPAPSTAPPKKQARVRH